MARNKAAKAAKTGKATARSKAAAKKPAKKPAKSARAKKVQPIPAGYRTVTPYLVVKGVARLIDFLKAAFDAREKFRSTMPDGTVMHAEIKIGDSMIMLGEASDNHTPTTAMVYLYVKDTDKMYHQAIKAGAESVMAPANQFYGDRNAGVKDQNGNQWWIGTHVEDVSPKEIQRRMASMKGA